MSRKHTVGFTIIELMLAMSFVSVLLVSVAMLTIQISRQYTAGVTMKEVNQAGTEISDDIRRTLAEAIVDQVKFKKTTDVTVLCTGQYSYMANNKPDSSSLRLNGETVRFIKIRDINGVYCDSPSTSITSASATEMLGGDRSLVVQQFSLSPDDAATSTVGTALREDYEAGRMIYTVSLTIRTGEASEITGNSCRPPSDVQSGAEYCAIDTFSFVARVGNTVN